MERNTNQKVLEVKNLRISFKTNSGTVKAVRGISFDLYKGRTLAIVGESGSGKSVTSKAILGILANNKIVEDGQIIFDISSEATHNLIFDDREISFEARFGEKALRCRVPYRNITGMFPQEEPNKGMMFSPHSDEDDEEDQPSPPKPVFSRVK